MALIIESIFISQKILCLFRYKVHEAYIKPLKPREALLSIKAESDDEESEEEYDIKELNMSDIEED